MKKIIDMNRFLYTNNNLARGLCIQIYRCIESNMHIKIDVNKELKPHYFSNSYFLEKCNISGARYCRFHPYLTLGQIKLYVYGACEQDPKNKNSKC